MAAVQLQPGQTGELTGQHRALVLLREPVGYDKTSLLGRPPQCPLARPLSLVLSHTTATQVPSPPTSSFRRIYGLIVQLLPSESVVRDCYTSSVII